MIDSLLERNTMENKLENSEKKCPQCKSYNIKYMGASHERKEMGSSLLLTLARN